MVLAQEQGPGYIILPVHLFFSKALRGGLLHSNFTLIALTTALALSQPAAFVTLDTSAPDSASRPDSLNVDPVDSFHADSRKTAREFGDSVVASHHHSILFLSSDDVRIYAEMGVLRLLQEHGLVPDLVLAEAHSVLVAAGWGLGYSMGALFRQLTQRPLGYYLTPLQYNRLESHHPRFAHESPQFEMLIQNQSDVYDRLQLGTDLTPNRDEYLHLAWLIAKLTHNGPRGPRSAMDSVYRPIAFQMLERGTGRVSIEKQGDIQRLLKASLQPMHLNRGASRESGLMPSHVVTGNSPALRDLPFSATYLFQLAYPREWDPPSLQPEEKGWKDSLLTLIGSRQTKEGPNHIAKKPDVVEIRLQPPAGFDPQTATPKQWYDLGYTSALMYIDVFTRSLRSEEVPLEPELASVMRHPANVHRDSVLVLNAEQVSVNQLESGGRQYLLDLIQKSLRDRPDSTGNVQIQDIIQSGFYSGLDLEWARDPVFESSSLIFSGRERARLKLGAGGNVATFHGPEAFAWSEWAEPFYLPFEARVAAQVGGRERGYGARLALRPLYPVTMDLALTWIQRTVEFPVLVDLEPDWDPIDMLMDENILNLDLTFHPTPYLHATTRIARHRFIDRQLEDELAREYFTTDFVQELQMDFGPENRLNPQGSFWRGTFSSRNPDNLFGTLRQSTSSFESLLRLDAGVAALSVQHFLSNRELEESLAINALLMGEIDALSFQREYLLQSLHGTNFVNLRLDFLARLGRLDLRANAGAFDNYHQRLSDYTVVKGESNWAGYWELNAEVQTPIGPLRGGIGSIENRQPLMFAQIGVNVDLLAALR